MCAGKRTRHDESGLSASQDPSFSRARGFPSLHGWLAPEELFDYGADMEHKHILAGSRLTSSERVAIYQVS